MAELEYVGRFPDADFGLMHKGGVDYRFKQVAVNQDDVDNAVIPRRSELVLPSYVQQQDALLARKSYVDSQDDLRELRTSLGAANGIASLGADGKVPTSQIPALEDYTPRYFNATSPDNTNWSNQTTTTRTLHTFSIPYPGYPYSIWCFGHVGCRSVGNWSHAEIEVRIGSTSGTVIAQGFGTESQSWHWIKVLPAANPGDAAFRYTSAATLYVRGSRASGSAAIEFTANLWSFAVHIIPAL